MESPTVLEERLAAWLDGADVPPRLTKTPSGDRQAVPEEQAVPGGGSAPGERSREVLTVDLWGPRPLPAWADWSMAPREVTRDQPAGQDGTGPKGSGTRAEADPANAAARRQTSDADDGPVARGAPGAQGAPDAPDPGRVHAEPDLDPAVAELRDVGRDRAILDSAMLQSVRAIVDTTRDHVLDRRTWVGLELNTTQIRALKADVKRATITEVSTRSGSPWLRPPRW